MKLYKDFRIIIFVIAMLIALIAIHPTYSNGLSSRLQYGLDLEGGTWLQLKLEGVITEIDADPSQIIKKEFSDAFGDIEITDRSDTEITFKTPEPIIDKRKRQSVYTASENGHSIRLEIEGKQCQDTMSDDTYESTVTLIIDGKRYRGCGKALH